MIQSLENWFIQDAMKKKFSITFKSEGYRRIINARFLAAIPLGHDTLLKFQGLETGREYYGLISETTFEEIKD